MSPTNHTYATYILYVLFISELGLQEVSDEKKFRSNLKWAISDQIQKLKMADNVRVIIESQQDCHTLESIVDTKIEFRPYSKEVSAFSFYKFSFNIAIRYKQYVHVYVQYTVYTYLEHISVCMYCICIEYISVYCNSIMSFFL